MSRVWNSTIERRTRLRQKTPLRARGRRKRRFWKRVEAGTLYGEYHQWVRELRCILADKHECIGAVEAHHVYPSWVEDYANQVPLCWLAHRGSMRTSIHVLGKSEFNRVWDVDVDVVRTRLARLYAQSTPETGDGICGP
jgi:hypothetical protein